MIEFIALCFVIVVVFFFGAFHGNRMGRSVTIEKMIQAVKGKAQIHIDQGLVQDMAKGKPVYPRAEIDLSISKGLEIWLLPKGQDPMEKSMDLGPSILIQTEDGELKLRPKPDHD